VYETVLKELDGLELGCQKPIAMMDGYNFNGAKMYKDTMLGMKEIRT